MALDFQLAAVKFTEGLDTRTQAKLVVPGKWAKLDNLTMAEDQTPRRRDGVTNLVAGRTGNGLSTYAKQLLAINGGDVYSVSKSLSTANIVSGKVGYVGIAKKEIFRSVGMQDSCDCAIGSVDGTVAKNLACYVWRDKTGGAVATGVNVALFDESTGTVLIPSTQMRTSAAVFCPRVVFCSGAGGSGGTFFIFYMQGTSLYCRTILMSSPTVLGNEVALITSANLANLNFDCCAFGTQAAGGAAAMVSYGWADGVRSVRTIKVGAAAGVPAIQAGPTDLATQVALPIANLCGLTCIPVGSTLGATFTLCHGAGAPAATGVLGTTISTAWVVQSAGVVHATGPVVNNPCHITATANAAGTSITLFHDDRSSWATNVSNFMYRIACSSVMVQTDIGGGLYSADFGGGATDPAGPRGPYIAGKAFTAANGNVFLPVEVLENYQGLAATKANNNQQSTFFLYDFGPNAVQGNPRADCIAHALYGAVGVATINNNAPTVSTPCSTPAVGDGSYGYATTERTLLSFVGGFNVSPTGVVRLTLAPNTTTAIGKAQLGESGYFAGGILGNYDGQFVTEHPFHLFPEGINVEVVAGGGAMTAGTHQVVCIYEWVDHAGQRHQSAPSLPVSATVAANDRLRVRVPTLHIGQDGGANGTAVDGVIWKCTIVAYVTQANGLSFNRVATTAAGAAGTANDISVAYVTLPLIDAADATYALNELLYNQPNLASTTLPNLAPPPINGLCVHGQRLFFDIADQPFTYGYSQVYANNLGLQFNPALGGTWPVEGGTFKGFCELDEKVILFCSEKLFVSYGTGPNAAGSYSNYSDMQEIPGDVGCSDPASIVRVPKGIMFKSAKGFYLLGRDLSVQYIGEGVAAFDSYTITSAVMMKDRQEIRFGTNSTTHPQLVYCYLDGGQWSTNSYQAASYVTIDAVWWPTQAQYVAIDATFGVQTDSANKYDSFAGSTQGIIWTARTSFLHLSELGGYQRVRWMMLTGTSQIAATGGFGPISLLGITIYADDNNSGTFDSFTVDLSTIAFVDPLSTMDLRHKLVMQKCKSVSFQFTDTPDSTAASSSRQMDGIQGLTLEVGLRKGTLRLPAGQGVS